MSKPNGNNGNGHNGDANATMAVFLDLENIAIGANDAHYPQFDIQKVLESLLLRGNIVVKKAYCDFGRYTSFKRGLHETAFELIEIPHTRMSGKNSADIRMVVDALDLSYTLNHIDTFVIISGDSDFSPLVSKLRANGKRVIGVGVKQSSSGLFISNCDEFIYYDDLVRAEQRLRSAVRPPSPATKQSRQAKAQTSAPAEPEMKGPSLEKALDQIATTAAKLADERGADAPLWGSMIKQAIRRLNPGFHERAYGFQSFNDMLKEAQTRGMIALDADERSGGFLVQVPAAKA